MSTLSDDHARSRENVSRALEQGTLRDVRRLIRDLDPGDVAHILESSPPRYRHVLWQLIEGPQEAEVLNELGDELQLDFLQSMEPDQVAQLTEELDDDDVADILQQLPEAFTQRVLVPVPTHCLRSYSVFPQWAFNSKRPIAVGIQA